MTGEKIYINQYGTTFRLDTDPPADDGKWYESDGVTERAQIDISGASYKIQVKKPSGTIVEWTATRYGTTTKIEYTSVSGDLDEAGKYKMQALLEWAAPAAAIPGETISVKVYERFK